MGAAGEGTGARGSGVRALVATRRQAGGGRVPAEGTAAAGGGGSGPAQLDMSKARAKWVPSVTIGSVAFCVSATICAGTYH
jgi:hypothetical protein